MKLKVLTQNMWLFLFPISIDHKKRIRRLATKINELKPEFIALQEFFYKNDINYLLKQNDVVPCIFTEKKNDGHYILQFDRNIGQDNYKYTAWRKTIGSAYDIRCDVLLIADNTLFDLAGNICKFDDLKRSEVVVSSQFLARFI